MSKLNIISAFPNDALLTNNNTLSSKLFDMITLAIAATINVIDLFGSFGTSLFSCSKNGFSPFLIPLFVKYKIILSNTKDIAIIEYLYFISVKNFSTYCSPSSRYSKY